MLDGKWPQFHKNDWQILYTKVLSLMDFCKLAGPQKGPSSSKSSDIISVIWPFVCCDKLFATLSLSSRSSVEANSWQNKEEKRGQKVNYKKSIFQVGDQ